MRALIAKAIEDRSAHGAARRNGRHLLIGIGRLWKTGEAGFGVQEAAVSILCALHKSEGPRLAEIEKIVER